MRNILAIKIKKLGTRLSNYLDNLEEGKPIAYDKFLATLPAKYKFRHQQLFEREHVGNGRYYVKFIDPETLVELRTFASIPLSRVEAASQGDSHLQRVSAQHILVHHQNSIDLPDVVRVTKDEKGNYTNIDMRFSIKPLAIVIENEENFYQYREMLLLCKTMLGLKLSSDLSDIDVYYGSGWRVASEGMIFILQQYETVHCAFDYDLAGLRMIETLANQLNGKVVPLFTDDFFIYQDKFNKVPDNVDDLYIAAEIAIKLGSESLAYTIKTKRHFMEQEQLLGGEKSE